MVMRFISVALLLCSLTTSSCEENIVKEQAASNAQNKQLQTNVIDKESAIKIAEKEFIKESRFPTKVEYKYVVRVIDEEQNWEVVFRFIEANGGPAHYYVDKTTGEIVKRRIYQ